MTDRSDDDFVRGDPIIESIGESKNAWDSMHSVARLCHVTFRFSGRTLACEGRRERIMK